MNINEILSNIKNLPTTPQILPRLLGKLRDHDASADDIVDLIKLDPPMMAQIIKISNSGYYAIPKGNTDLKRAIAHIGLGETYKIVTIIVGREIASAPIKAYNMEGNELWQTAIGAAICMEILAKHTASDPTDAYTIGIFHNLGKLVISNTAFKDYAPVFEKIENENISQAEAERAVLGFDYCEVGGILLEYWDFPTFISSPVRFQLDPMATTENRQTACMLHISLYLLSAIGLASGRDAYAFKLNEEAVTTLKLTQKDTEQMMIQVLTRFEEIKQMFS